MAQAKFKLYNETTGHWVIDADSDDQRPYQANTLEEAMNALKRVQQLQQLNPEHKNDIIRIYPNI